jgi:hypothetical protein
VSVIRRWHVVKREEDASDDLREEEKQQAGAEDIGPSGATRDGFVEGLVQQRVDAGALVDPFNQAGACAGRLGGGPGAESFVIESPGLRPSLPWLL